MLSLPEKLKRFLSSKIQTRFSPDRRKRKVLWNFSGIESLEGRRLLSGGGGNVISQGNVLNISITAFNDTLSVVSSGSFYTFILSGTNTGWTGSATGVTTNGSNLTVDSTGLALYNTINITDTSTLDQVTFGDSGTNSYQSDFNVLLDSMGDTSTAPGAISFVGATSFAGSHRLDVTTTKNILFNAGASLTSSDGNITLNANQQVPYLSGSFTGIDINQSTIQINGAGTLSLTGRGGTTGGGNHGITIRGGSVIQAGTSGTLTVLGMGGAGTGDSNFGVAVTDSGSLVTTLGASVQLSGTGGGSGSSAGNLGVLVQSGGAILAGGSGTVSVAGQGGNLAGTGGSNHGVSVAGASSLIGSSGGDVLVTGSEGGQTTSLAVNLVTNAAISTAKAGGNLTVTGDSMNFDSGSAISTNSSSRLTLTPNTSGVAINLGGGSDSKGGPLSISTTDLSALSTGTLQIGSSTSGSISTLGTTALAANLVLQAPSGTALLPGAAGQDFNLSGKTLSIANGMVLNVAINGPSADTGYSQLNVADSLNLTGLSLALSGSYVSTAGQVFTIVSANHVTGTFNGLAENAMTSLNGRKYSVNYTSTAVTLTDAAPVVTSQPAPITVDPGGTATFSASATGTPTPTVQWQVNTGTGWSNIQGATSTTYVFTANTADNGSLYRAVFTNTGGYTNSNAAALKVRAVSTTTLASSANPSTYGNSVTFTATVNAGASGSITFKDGSTTLGTTTIANSTASFTTSLLLGGSHSISATYSGDDNFAHGTSAPFTQTVNTASTTTSVTSSANPATLGNSVTFTATATPGTTGTVTFKDGTTTLGTATLVGSTAAFSTTALSAGNHSITAVYGGDGNYSTSTSSALSQSIIKPSTTQLTSSSNPSTYGNSVTFTATVTATATGTITFKDGTTTLGTATLVGSIATFTTSSLSGGSHGISAVYGGDSAFAGSTSSSLTQTVNTASTSTTLASSLNPSTYGNSVTFTATVTTGATGTITFKDGSTTLGTATLVGSTTTFTTSLLTGGSHGIIAVYNGDSNYSTSASTSYSQVVNPANTTTSLTSSNNPSIYGNLITFTATVTPGATGTVTFKDGSTTLGTGTVTDTTAIFSTTSLIVGSHSISAIYGGDTNYNSSTSSTLTETVNKASSSVSLASSANPSSYSDTVTFTATVTTGATGSVTFKDGSIIVGFATISGSTATFSTSSLTVGTHTLSTVYSGDSNFNGSTSSNLTQTVNKATSSTSLSSSANPSNFGDSVTFTATVTAGATGTVTFEDGATTLGTGTLSGSTATFTTSSLTGGSHSITVVYGGDGNYTASTSTILSQTVNRANSNTTLISSINPSTYGNAVTFTAAVTAGATGSITFKDGSTTLGTGTISGGTTTFSTTALSGGTHSITAVFNGDTNYLSSTSAPLAQIVNQASSSTALTSSLNPSTYGTLVTFTATITTGATGTVQFYDGQTALGSAVTISGNHATYTTTTLTGGTHSITAAYGGDVNYLGSTSSALTQTVNRASSTTTLVSSTNPSTYGNSVTFTATVTTGASGTVTFKDGSTTLGTGTISGTTATFTTVALTGGNHSITAAYGGDTNYLSSTSATLTQTVNKAASTTSLTSSLSPSTYGDMVTFTAAVTAGATGTITFKDGSTTLGTSTISGSTAIFTTTTLTGGNHSITAVYNGDINYFGSTSTALTQSVNAAASTTTLSSSSNPSTYTSPVTFTATIAVDATGTVIFKEGSTILGTSTISSGSAVFITTSLSVGTHTLTAVYGGDLNYLPSTSSQFVQTVNRGITTTTITSSANPSTFGNTITLTATVTAGTSGTVQFFDGGTALGNLLTLTGSTASLITSAFSGGSHSITAVYGGDSNYSQSTSDIFTQVVNRAGTSTTVVSSINPTTFGDSITFTATVSAGTTGTVTFWDGTNSLGSGNLSGTTATFSTSALGVGNHSVTATYDGDTNYAPSTSAILTQTVKTASSTTSLISSANPSNYGALVTLTATVSTGATGSITFKDGSATLGTGTITGHTATFTTSTLVAGTHSLTAVYPGDANFVGSTSSTVTQVVNMVSSTTTLTSSSNPSTFNTSVTFTATVTTGATGTVQFYDGGTAIGSPVTISGTTATYATTSLSLGVHSITATYSGDTNFNGSTSTALSQSVRTVTTTTLTSDANPSVYGNPIKLTATVTAGATGTVTFKDYGNVIGTGTLYGTTATFTTAVLPAANHLFRAFYQGDSNYANSASIVLTQVINKANTTTTLTSSANPAKYGDTVTLTATVPADAGGTITFKNGSTTLGTATISSGVATFNYSNFVTGTFTLTAVYGGDSNYYSSTSAPFTQVVNQAASTTSLASSANPSIFGTSVTFTATVPANATGSVSFLDGTTVLGSGTISANKATFTTSSLVAGSHTITAAYSGDSNFLGSTSSTLTQTVSQASSSTSVSSSLNPSTFSTSVTFWATVISGATGTITFKDGSTILGTSNITGTTASFTTAALTGGSHSITAVYGGDSNYLGSTSTALTQTINTAASSTSLTSSVNPSIYGNIVSFTAAVTPGATGSVTFKDGSTTLAFSTISGTTATFSTAALTGGSHNITAVYGGDSNFSSSTSAALTQTVNLAASATSLTSSLDPSTFGNSVTFTATVTAGATGTVTFKDGAATLGTGTIAGTSATFTTTVLTGGSHNITAVYAGDTNYSSSTSSVLTQTVSKAVSTTQLSSSLNPAVYGTSITFTATLTNGATGTVTFKDGSTVLGTGTITGSIATFTTATLTGGSHSISAAYDGDMNFSSSSSSALTQTVNTAVTTTSLTSSLNPSTYGDGVTFTARVTPGATGSVSFYDGSTMIGTTAITGTTATFEIWSLLGGLHSITAVYLGDTNYSGSTSAVLSQVVNTASSKTTLVSSANPSNLGTSVTFTATVTSGATGTVQFFDGTTAIGTPVALNGSSASYATSALTAGSHSITAAYSGDIYYSASTSPSLSQTVNKAGSTTVVTSSANPSNYHDSVTFTATVTSGATGTVQFYDGTQTLGTAVPLTGSTATCTTSDLPGGNHSITAIYSGDSTFASSTSRVLTQTVNTTATTTTLQSSASLINFGDSVTFTATVTTGATGTVTFFDGSSPLGTVALTGKTAAFTTSSLTGALHIITAVYNGDAQYSSSTSNALNEYVFQAPIVVTQPVSVSANSGSTATFSAAASGYPVPTVKWQVLTTATGAVWTDIPGAISPTYTTNVLDISSNGWVYRALFSNGVGAVVTNEATLSVVSAEVTVAGVKWGSAASANLVDTGDGRLLPSGRYTDLPWVNIDRITLTLNHPITSLLPKDIAVVGKAFGKYQVSSVTGQGTSWMITLAGGGISNADRVTVTVSNSQLTSYTRRLDVLPGDINDDGVVNSVDYTKELQSIPRFYFTIYDIDGSGTLTAFDAQIIRRMLGRRLP